MTSDILLSLYYISTFNLLQEITLPLQPRHARHSLFSSKENVKNVGSNPVNGINYDIEALKLDRARNAWPGKAESRHSISSEDSLSDCEELGANHDNYHRESALQTFR